MQHRRRCHHILSLDPAVQGLGYAKALYLKFCKEKLAVYGATRLRLRVLKSNNRAQSLYASMGMVICNESQVDYEMTVNVDELISTLRTEINDVA